MNDGNLCPHKTICGLLYLFNTTSTKPFYNKRYREDTLHLAESRDQYVKICTRRLKMQSAYPPHSKI